MKYWRVYITTKTGHRTVTVTAPNAATARNQVALAYPEAIIGNAAQVKP